MTSSELSVPSMLREAGIIELPDTKTHRFRFDIPSESSNALYRISQRITNGSTHGQYECSCKSWIYSRGGDGTGLCKHLKHFKPALDNLVDQAKKLGTGVPVASLTTPKTKPSKGLLDDLDGFEQISPEKTDVLDGFEVVIPSKLTVEIKNGCLTLNDTAQLKIGSTVQLLYSASKKVIVLKPVDTADNSFDVVEGVIEANDFLKTVGKTKSGELTLESISLKGDVTAYAVAV